MQDLTQGSIAGHLARMSVPIAIGMVFQTLYLLVDIYFVAQLGEAALAGLNAAGNLQFIVMSMTQVLGVGAMALISHAAGRKDRADANRVFNQSLGLAALCGLVTLAGGYTVGHFYVRSISADAQTVLAGIEYLDWFLPGLALQFALISMGSALRGTGIVKPTLVVQVLTVAVNVVLCPVLIRGWVTGVPLGVAGAGLATSIAVAFGVLLLYAYFRRLEQYVAFDRTLMRPQIAVWKRILGIGLPPGGEFLLLFVYMAVVYWALRGFGAEAQAGFGVGVRITQAIFLPAMALAFATAPVAGQNFGAGDFGRVRATFTTSVSTLSVIMLLLTAFTQWQADSLIALFTRDAQVIAYGADYLHIISYNFVFVGIVFCCSGMFQALGNTLPALGASATRLITFALPALWMAAQPWFQVPYLWYLSVVTSALQCGLVWWLLRRALGRMPAATPARQPAI
jgi:putative MATE family efflux protein